MTSGLKRRPRRWAFFVPALALLIPLAVPARFYWQVTRPLIHKDAIDLYAGQYGIDPLFVLALVRVESGFSPSARSHRGAIGLMQLMPDTARDMAVRVGENPSTLNLEEPDINIHLGVHYLSLLKKEFGEDEVSLLAAYNAGPTNTRAWRGNDSLSPRDIPFPETRFFVTRVQRTHRWLRRLQAVKRFFHV